MELFDKYYSQISKTIIRPPRQQYDRADLGSSNFTLNGIQYKRMDIVMKNKRKIELECSFYKQRDQKDTRPVVIYLHGNSSSRLSALQYLQLLLPDINVFTVDLSGSGRSGGQFISLGYQEKQDVRTIIKYLKEEHQVEKILIWGRSMGAATAILYAAKYQDIDGLVLDSSFSDLQQLIMEIADSQVSLPQFVVRYCVQNVREKIKNIIKEKEKYNFDILQLKPIKEIVKITIPTYFMAGKQDTMVQHSHSVALHRACSSLDKEIELFQGGHNGSRPKDTLSRLELFVRKTLLSSNIMQSRLDQLDLNTQFQRLLENEKKFMQINTKTHRLASKLKSPQST